jgi:acetyltransferase-like isoleucine patch superfamily enzyme
MKSRLKSVGEDVFISNQVEIRRPEKVTVGNHTAIDTGFYCTVTADIGNYVHIGPYVTIIGGADGYIKLSDFSTVAAGSRLICGSDEHLGYGLVGPTIPEKYKDKLIIEPIILEPFANVGTNVIVMPGVTIAEGCVISAGSVVTKSTQPWKIYAGYPARAIKERPKEKIIAYARELGLYD